MQSGRTYPIVLAHGIARFDDLTDHLFQIDNTSQDDGLHYFRNIRTHLESRGFVVRHSHVEWAAGVFTRSRTLRRNIEDILTELRVPNVHIIAHSMGGLDARQMLFDGRGDGFHQRVASLSTLSTPHHGSPMADLLIHVAPSSGSLLGIDISGLKDLTTDACREFNADKKDWESKCGVRFRAYAGAQEFMRIFAPLKAAWQVIFASEGPNDGLVSVTSAKWQEEYFVPPVIDADHLNIIGWWEPAELWHKEGPFEMEARIKAFYLSIAEQLAAEFPVA